MTPKIKEFAENKYPVSHRTPHAKEFALQQYARREAYEGGIVIGAEFAEWASNEGWYYCNGFGFWENADYDKHPTTPELLDIFITEKMKKHENI